jgi:hypothetical protein
MAWANHTHTQIVVVIWCLQASYSCCASSKIAPPLCMHTTAAQHMAWVWAAAQHALQDPLLPGTILSLSAALRHSCSQPPSNAPSRHRWLLQLEPGSRRHWPAAPAVCSSPRGPPTALGCQAHSAAPAAAPAKPHPHAPAATQHIVCVCVLTREVQSENVRRSAVIISNRTGCLASHLGVCLLGGDTK